MCNIESNILYSILIIRLILIITTIYLQNPLSSYYPQFTNLNNLKTYSSNKILI